MQKLHVLTLPRPLTPYQHAWRRCGARVAGEIMHGWPVEGRVGARAVTPVVIDSATAKTIRARFAVHSDRQTLDSVLPDPGPSGTRGLYAIPFCSQCKCKHDRS